MQCSSCQFENMPGVELCGRCGGRLNLGAAEVDVNPPRASARAKRWRKLFPFQRFNFQVQEGLARASSMFREPVFDRPLSMIAVRMLVPGWPQIYIGNTMRGRIFLGLYLTTLLWGLLIVGTPTSAMLLGLALAVHISSIIDIVFVGCREWHERVVYTVMFCGVVGLLTYYPGILLATRVVIPQRIVLDAPPLQAGDVFLYNPSAYGGTGPELGDVVMYDISAAQIGVGGTQYIIRGLRIDRVVALSGQTLACDGEQLLLDDNPAPYSPLNEEMSSTKFSITAPDGHCLILPSTDPTIGGAVSGVRPEFCRVPHRNIRGKVFLRNQPFSRLWFVR